MLSQSPECGTSKVPWSMQFAACLRAGTHWQAANRIFGRQRIQLIKGLSKKWP